MKRMRTHYLIDSPVGCLTCVVSDGALVRVWAGETIPGGTDIGVEAPLRWYELEAQFADYFSGDSRHFNITTHIAGTPFQRCVWSEVQSIGYGEQRTFRQVAEALGDPYKARAVGQAIATHPLPIIFPGHRVVASGRKPDAFTETMRIKNYLAEMEAGHSGAASPSSGSAAGTGTLQPRESA